VSRASLPEEVEEEDPGGKGRPREHPGGKGRPREHPGGKDRPREHPGGKDRLRFIRKTAVKRKYTVNQKKTWQYIFDYNFG